MTVEPHGDCDARFLPLKQAFAENFEAGLELGASVAATWRGEPVLDLWAGWADVAQTRPWERDTLVPVSSTTKIMVTLCVLMLVDAGRIDLDAPIATYWPDFAAGGKDRVTVRDFFTHQAGAPGFTPPIKASLFLDWEASTVRLAAEDHWFDGERRTIYHGPTYGLIGGELVRRVDGRPPVQFFHEEVAAPADLDFYLGLADVPDPSRVAELKMGLVRPAAPPRAFWGGLSRRSTAAMAPGLTKRITSASTASPRPDRSRAAVPSSPAVALSTGGDICRRPWSTRPTRCRPAASAPIWAT